VASTPAQIHAVALGLESRWSHTPWFMEGLGLEVQPEPSWGRWYPGSSAPGWWRVLSESAELQRLVVLHRIELEDVVTPGLLWLRAMVNQQPLVWAPEGAMGSGYLVTPDIGLTLEKELLLERMKILDQNGWHGAFSTLDVRDPEAISRAFGGRFVPGAVQFDFMMGLAFSHGVNVKGFPKVFPSNKLAETSLPEGNQP